MNVQILRVAVNDRDAPMVAESNLFENLVDVLMDLLVGKESALAPVPRPDEMNRARTDANISSAVGVHL